MMSEAGHDTGDSLDSVPEVLERLSDHHGIPLSVNWEEVIEWAEDEFGSGEWHDLFVNVTHDAPTAENILTQPALRTYLLYVWDLAHRADDEHHPDPEIMTRFFWDPAQTVAAGAEGFRGLWASINAEFEEKGIDDDAQKVLLFLKFCIRATSHEQLAGPRRARGLSADIAATFSELEFLKVAFLPMKQLDEEALHHELEHLSELNLLKLLYFVREKYHTFKNKKTRHLADELLALIENTLVAKFGAAIMAEHSAKHTPVSDLAINTLNKTIWPASIKIREVGEKKGPLHIRNQLAQIEAHNKPQGIMSRIAMAIGKVFSSPALKGAASTGGLLQLAEMGIFIANRLDARKAATKEEKKEGEGEKTDKKADHPPGH